MSRPRLGLFVEGERPPGLTALVLALSRWCRPVGGEGADECEARLVVGPVYPAAAAGWSGPVALWPQGSQPSDAGTAPAIVLTEPSAAASHPEAVVVPDGLDLTRFPPITPFVRSRWRERFLLPPDLVVDLTTGALPAAVHATALAVASAVIVAGRDVARALAWGAPTVTDPQSARAVGAQPGTHLRTGDTTQERADAAAALAGDRAAASAIALKGRRLAETTLDVTPAARQVASQLGFLPSSTIAERTLDELWTPATSRLAHRVRLASAALTPAGGG